MLRPLGPAPGITQCIAIEAIFPAASTGCISPARSPCCSDYVAASAGVLRRSLGQGRAGVTHTSGSSDNDLHVFGETEMEFSPPHVFY